MTVAGGSPSSGRCLGWDHAGNLNCCQVGVREDHLICPFSTQLFSVRCLSYQLPHSSEHRSHLSDTSFPCWRLVFSLSWAAVYTERLFSSFKSIQDWVRPCFKLKNTSRLSHDFVSIMVLMVWVWGDFMPALPVISWLPLYHFIYGGEFAAVMSVNFSFSLHKSARRHSQQRTVSHCLCQALDELHTPQSWGTQGPPRHVYVQKLGLNPFCSVLYQSTQIPSKSQVRNTDMSK